MVAAIGLLVPASLGSTITVFGVGLTTATGALTLAGTLVNLAGSLLLSSAFAPDAPDIPTPENIQLNIRQSIGARIKHYGRVKAGGTVVFFRTRSGKFYRVVVHGHGEIDGIEKYFLNKGEVTINASGEVQEAQYQSGGRSRVILKNRFGLIPETHYSEVTAIWAEWASNYRNDGLWTSLTIAEQTPPADFRRVYPNNEPSIEIVARTTKVFDPRTGLTAFSDNAALVIADLIESPDGFNRAGHVNRTRLAAAADVADQAVPLAAGGTEPRWRLAGSYSLAEPPQSPLQRMLDACAGEVRLLPDGTIGIEVGGQSLTPTVTLTGADVLEYVEGDDGPDMLERYNTLPFTYVDPALAYTQTEGDPWHDAVRAAEDGEEAVGQLTNLDMAPSHRQARQAAKIKMGRANARQRLTIRFKPVALLAIYEPFIRLTDGDAGIDGVYKVGRYNLSVSDGSVTLQLTAFDQADFIATISDEGQPQALPTPDVSLGIPAPTNFTAGPQGVQTSASTFAAGIAAVWDAPPSDSLSPKLEYSPTGTGAWQLIGVIAGALSAQSPSLVDGAGYDLRLTFLATDGTAGTPVTLTNITASAVTTPPAVPTALSVADLTGGVARVTLTASSSASIWKTEIYRDAVLVASFYTAASESVSFDDASGAGNFDWTARSINVSGVASSTDAGPFNQTIT